MRELIDLMVDQFYEQNVEYFSNTLELTYPDGLDIEILKCGVLEKLASLRLDSKELEHVTYGVYNRPECFKLSNFRNEFNHSLDRWTVDYQDDFKFVSSIFANFLGRESEFTYREVCEFLQENPSLKFENHNHLRNAQLRVSTDIG